MSTLPRRRGTRPTRCADELRRPKMDVIAIQEAWCTGDVSPMEDPWLEARLELVSVDVCPKSTADETRER
jgi:hypothetical protein